MSAVAMLGAAIVAERRSGITAGHALDVFKEKAAVEFSPFTPDLAKGARRAWRRFGKGNRPAALKFGDSLACALAEMTGEPLLFKGEVFSRTDVATARVED